MTSFENLALNTSTYHHTDLLTVAPSVSSQNTSFDVYYNNVTTVCDRTQHSMQYRIYRIVIDVFLVGIICVVGFIGNALSIAVLKRDRDKKNTTNWLLQTLAFSDTLYLLACVFLQTIKGIKEYTDWCPILDTILPYMEPYIWVFASIAQTITVWLVMLVTIDRYIAICKPLKTQMRTLQRAKLAVTLVVVTAIIYNIPRFLERRIMYVTCTNRTVVRSIKTPLRESNMYFLIYKTILYFIFRTVGPLLTLIGLNLRLIQALQAVRKKHRDMTRSTKNRDNITLMLVVVVSIFVICEIPDLILRVVVTIRELYPNFVSVLVLRYINAVTNMMLTVNSSINFLIYCLIGQKFRKILRQMCCGRIKGGIPEVSEIEPLNTRTTGACVTSASTMAPTNGLMQEETNGKTAADTKGSDVQL